MKKVGFIAAFLFNILFLLNISCYANEMKGIWVATVFNLDYPNQGTTSSEQLKSEADAIINNCADMGINNIFLQVRPMSDAFYKSEIYPWSNFLTGSQGTAPDNNFDPLEYWIEKAHSKGIKIHAWVNPYRATKGNDANDTLYNALALSNPAKKHPEYLVKYENEYYYDPAIPEVRQLVIDGIMEIINNYDIDGIHFDDYFYPGKDFSDDESFEKYGSGYSDKSEWRRENVNTLIKDLQANIKEADSSVEFGISPSGIWANKSSNALGSDTNGMESYTQLYADTRKWAVENWIDYIAPQIYWNIGHSAADYETLANWWADALKDSSTKLYIGMGDYRTADAQADSVWYGTQEIEKQLELNNSISKISGEIHYRYDSVISNSALVNLYKQKYKTNDSVSESSAQQTTVITDSQTQASTAVSSSQNASSGISIVSSDGSVNVIFNNDEKTANLTVDGIGIQIAKQDGVYTKIEKNAAAVGAYEINAPSSVRVNVNVPELNENEKYYVFGLNKENTSLGKILPSFYYSNTGKVEFSSDLNYTVVEIVKISGNNVLTLTIGETETTINGKQEKLDAPAEIKEGYTFVPVRYIGESLGVAVEWDESSRKAVFTKDGKSTSVTIGEEIDGYDGIEAYIKNNRTMVPARYIYETFGAYVLWEPNGKVVTVVG